MERMLDDTYRLLEEVGKGGFGAVFKGVRKGFEGMGPVAIKVLSRNPSMKPKDYARFQREASLMSQLAHPGIVSVYELVQTDSCYYIVMELVSGVNLKEFVTERGGQLGLSEVLDVLIQAADALEYVHGHQIQHRDIKPQNILICDRGTIGESRFQVKIVDFGVARLAPQALGGEINTGQEIVGTFAYMAPEATGLVDYALDHRCDIYSLGVVAFELLAGRVPFLRATASEVARAHAYDKAPTLSEVLGREVAPIIEAIVAKCIAKNPADRYQSIFGLACDLKRVRDELRSHGKIGFFEIASKDFDISNRFESVYVGHDEVLDKILTLLGTEKSSTRLSWILVRGGAGCGKSRILDELRRRLETDEVRYLYLKFSESERRLPYQALSMAVNDYLTSFERSRLPELRALFEELVRRTGADGARHLAALVPVLRPMLEEKLWSESRSLGPMMSTPSTVLNQAFKEMFDAMVGGSKRLVFLLDDIHLGDASTIALLSYLLEGMNTGVNFSFALTKRDSAAPMPVMVEALLKRAAGLRRRFHEVILPRFDDNSVAAYLKAIGIDNVHFELVQYFMRRTDSSPHQMQLLIKQFIEKGALLQRRAAEEGEGTLSIDWQAVRSIKVELFSIDALMASLDTLESRDREILLVAAICQDPTPFELFRLDNEFSAAELETRLVALVHRGLMGEGGDDAMPTTRRKFALSHERIRTVLLSDLKISRVKEIHLLIATRIRQLYRNPGRAEILLLAKHVDGAAESYEAKGAAISFMKAARVCIADGDLNLGRYYLEKAVLRQQQIAGDPIATQLLKEIQEARYMIYAAQGNLVAASEACRQLIVMTGDPEKKEKLELYWAQLQLSLGRHSITFQKCEEILEHHFPGLVSDLRERMPAVDWLADVAESAIGKLLMSALGRRWFNALYNFIGFASGRRVSKLVRPEATVHSLALMLMSQLHGHEGSLAKTLFLSARLSRIIQSTERWGALIRVLLGALEMRKGYIRSAYRAADRVEEYFTRKGNIESLRWLQSLRSIWYDYPSGRIDRLLQIFGGSRAVGYPTSGLLHFETYGLRAWLRLISPASFPSVDLERRRERRRQESRASTAMSTSRASPREAAVAQANLPMDSLLENNNARRVLDSGENGQFTALALFSDAFRFALCDRIESLKRAAEQMQRQQSFSAIGEAFQLFGVTLLAHVSGRYAEALRHYKKACRRILQSEAQVIALPVSDALRYAVLFFPIVATAAGQQKGLWGQALLPWLERVDSKLRQLEGRGGLRRSSMSMLFAAMAHYSRGETRGALTELDAALRESRVQKMALLECLSLSMMALFCAERKITRASEHLSSVYSTAGQYRWKLFERFALAVSRTHSIELPGLEQRADTRTTFSTRGRSTQGGLNDLIRHLPELVECTDLARLMQEACQLAARALGVKSSYFFLRDPQTARFEQELFLGQQGTGDSSPVVGVDEIRKWLPNSLDEHVKLVAIDDSAELTPEKKSRVYHEAVGTVLAFQKVQSGSDKSSDVRESEDSVTVAIAVQPANDGATLANVDADGVSNTIDQREWQLEIEAATEINKAPSRARFLILVAVSHQSDLLGWIVLADSGRASTRVGDMEQELMILGMHVGYLVARNSSAPGWRSGAASGASERSLVSSFSSQSQWPDWFRVESYGAGFGWPHVGWRVYGISEHLFFACVWRLDAPRERVSRRLGELLARHVQLFAHSLRKQAERPRLVPVAERLMSDFTAILGSISHWEFSLDSVDLNFLLFDYQSRHAFEGVFGAELFSFSGDSRVEREEMHELQGVLGLEQSLFFRERQRALKGHCGWAFGIDQQSRVALFRFADVDFMERYVPHVLERQNLLPETLGVQSRGRSTQMLAVFALDPDLLSLQQTGTGGGGRTSTGPMLSQRRRG